MRDGRIIVREILLLCYDEYESDYREVVGEEKSHQIPQQHFELTERSDGILLAEILIVLEDLAEHAYVPLG